MYWDLKIIMALHNAKLDYLLMSNEFVPIFALHLKPASTQIKREHPTCAVSTNTQAILPFR
jgi:hypothetical protein